MKSINIKQMKNFIFYTLISVMALGAVGCQDLAVENENSPDRTVAFAQPGDVVNLISGTWADYWSSIQHYASGPYMFSTIADEISSSWGNWGMRDMSSEPRIAWNNSSTYGSAGSTRNPWFGNYRGISNANDALQSIARAEEEESVDNNRFTREGYDTAQLKAFAKMNQGLMHGTLSLIFDQAFVFDETVDLENDALELRPYMEVNQEAIRMLEEARAIARDNQFSISWIWGVDLSSQDMIQLINSFIARFMVQVARDPAERAAVDWNTVVDLVEAGITVDFAPVGSNSGPGWDGLKIVSQRRGWTAADYRTIGPADESGGYQNWLNTPLLDRVPFDIVTADRRIVGSPDDPTMDGSDFAYYGASTGLRPDRGTYHFSSHTHKRYRYYDGPFTGPMPHMILTEMHMYHAEGLLRTGGSTDTVAELINITRVARGEMNPAMGSDPAGSPADDQSHLDSASLWAKLKHERRIETYATAAGLAYYDDRGLGDLVTGTPVHFPVPGRELETIGLQNYTFGGVGGSGGAPVAYREVFDIDMAR